MRKQLDPPSKPLGPEIAPEDLLAQAKHHDSEIQNAVAEMKQIEKSVFQACATLIGLPEESDRSRLIWTGIVEFANHAGSSSRIPKILGMKLRATLVLCTHSDETPFEQRGSVHELECFEDVRRLAQSTSSSPDEAFLTLAARAHPSFKSMLQWIADPNSCDHAQRVESLGFLLQQGNEGQARYEYEVNDKFDDTGNIGYPFFYWKRPEAFETILAPIAKFIFECIEGYHDRGIPLDQATPIVLCRRDGCGRFAISERKTKNFCSDSCRSLNRQKEKAEEHAAYMREYRKKNYTKPFKTKRGSGK